MSLDGPEWDTVESVFNLSKNLEGTLNMLGKPKHDVCASTKIATLKTKHVLSVKVRHGPCEIDKFSVLDGLLVVKELVHVIIDDPVNKVFRGAHYGGFVWTTSSGYTIEGQIWGITNAGTHRPPYFKCESCDVMQHMEGRLVGTIVKGEYFLRNRVFGSYTIRLKQERIEEAKDCEGALEGILVRKC